MKYAFLSYIAILICTFLAYYIESKIFDYLIPFLLIALPLIAGSQIQFSFSKKNLLFGLFFSFIFITPYFLYEIYLGKIFILPSISQLLFQLLVISTPEEFFFRGFLQKSIGNNIRGIIITSAMFSIAHLPAFLYNQDIYAPLTFFPSLIMGFIYMKTNNTMPCIIFHFFANIVWTGLR